MKNWPKIQYNQVQFGINASLEINEKACDCSLFTGRRYVGEGVMSILKEVLDLISVLFLQSFNG